MRLQVPDVPPGVASIHTPQVIQFDSANRKKHQGKAIISLCRYHIKSCHNISSMERKNFLVSKSSMKCHECGATVLRDYEPLYR